VPPLVIGLTVAAYGTSAPELAVSTEAAADHLTPIALGNVIGSCIANISLILGLAALIAPPRIDGTLIRREIPILIGSVIAVPITLADGVITRVEGSILVGCAVVFTIASLAMTGRVVDDDAFAPPPPPTDERPSRVSAIVVCGLGVIMLVFGSELFIGGARAAPAVGHVRSHARHDHDRDRHVAARAADRGGHLDARPGRDRGRHGDRLEPAERVPGARHRGVPAPGAGRRAHARRRRDRARRHHAPGIVVLRGRRTVTRAEGGCWSSRTSAFLIAAAYL
jgi:hypothetical protein